MNLIEELQSLDVNDIGRWPLVFRAAVIALVFLAVTFAGIWFTIVKDKAPVLKRAEAEEQELRVTFENKQRKAANYDASRRDRDSEPDRRYLADGTCCGPAGKAVPAPGGDTP
jgi:type IV pilus assembly protein PilO